MSKDVFALTPRELQVAELIAQEMTNPEIAERLGVETGTVKEHVWRILRKLGADNRYQVAGILGIENGQEAGSKKELPTRRTAGLTDANVAELLSAIGFLAKSRGRRDLATIIYLALYHLRNGGKR